MRNNEKIKQWRSVEMVWGCNFRWYRLGRSDQDGFLVKTQRRKRIILWGVLGKRRTDTGKLSTKYKVMWGERLPGVFGKSKNNRQGKLVKGRRMRKWF